MKPGKLFIPINCSIPLFPAKKTTRQKGPMSIVPNRLFFVVSVELDEQMAAVARWHDLKTPWLVLYREKIWLAEIAGRSLMDLTPFAPWDTRYKHNAELLEEFKKRVANP